MLKQFLLLLCSLVLLSVSVHAEEGDVSPIKVIKDLRVEARLAEQKSLPLLILFSVEDCEFCAYIRSEYLEPMQVNTDYSNKVIIREIIANDFYYLRDFSGELIGADKLALRYKADLSPTVVIMDSKGRVLHEPIVGIVSRHYYDKQLDEAIDTALSKLSVN